MRGWRRATWSVRAAMAAVALACGVSTAQTPPAAPAGTSPAAPPPWLDTPASREFRQRVLDLAVLYGDSSGLDGNGYLIETSDKGPAAPGCRYVLARISLAGATVSNETFEICKDKPH